MAKRPGRAQVLVADVASGHQVAAGREGAVELYEDPDELFRWGVVGGVDGQDAARPDVRNAERGSFSVVSAYSLTGPTPLRPGSLCTQHAGGSTGPAGPRWVWLIQANGYTRSSCSFSCAKRARSVNSVR